MMIGKDAAMIPRFVEEFERVGLGNAELSRRLDCGLTTVNQWVYGINIPNAFYMAKLYRLGFDIIYILTGDHTRGGEISA